MKKKNPVSKDLFYKGRLLLGGGLDDNIRGVMIDAYKFPFGVVDISRGAGFRICRTIKKK